MVIAGLGDFSGTRIFQGYGSCDKRQGTKGC